MFTMNGDRCCIVFLAVALLCFTRGMRYMMTKGYDRTGFVPQVLHSMGDVVRSEGHRERQIRRILES